jgi:GT2 family glycosyltransferase
MKNKLLISICILSYNRKEELVRTIEYIKKSTYSHYEIVIVDNVSPDGTFEYISALYKKDKTVHIYKNPKNNGIAGWNQAFEKAKGELLFALDDDSHPEKYTLSKIVEAFSSDNKLDILACNVQVFSTKQSAFKYLRKNQSKPIRQYDFIGSGFVMKKNVLETVGGFSESLFMYAHETDFAIRAVDAGFIIKLYPDIIVSHRISPINRTSGRSLYYCTRNFFIIAWTYFPVTFALNVTFAVFLENAILGLKNGEFPQYIKGIATWPSSYKSVVKIRRPVSRETAKKINTHFPFSFQGFMRRIQWARSSSPTR